MMQSMVVILISFLSTLSLRRATWLELFLYYQDNNFYPRSPCGERPLRQLQSALCRNFYPRSPCGERRYLINTYHRIFGISIHALLAESDHPQTSNHPHNTNFYPRSPCGERPVNIQRPTAKNDFYPRSPCGERHLTNYHFTGIFIFLSTLSLRRATPRGDSCYLDNIISIHALLAESDTR